MEPAFFLSRKPTCVSYLDPVSFFSFPLTHPAFLTEGQTQTQRAGQFRARNKCNSILRLKPASTPPPLAFPGSRLAPGFHLSFTNALCQCSICPAITVHSHRTTLKRLYFIKFKYRLFRIQNKKGFLCFLHSRLLQLIFFFPAFLITALIICFASIFCCFLPFACKTNRQAW